MRVSGLILVSHALNDLAAAEIEAWDARVVLLHERPEAIDDVAVVTDDLGGAQLAVRHLLEHGYDYVACMGGIAETPCRRRPGLRPRRGLAARDGRGRASPPRAASSRPSYNRYDAYQAALKILSGPDRPPAIFCSTDDQAIGLLRAARELRIDVPGELAVAGFDDIKEAALADPPLTTVASDRPAMARAAVDLVLDDGLRVAGSRRERLKVFPSRLVTRRSCGCA